MWMLAAIPMLCSSQSGFAQVADTEKANPYFHTSDMPDMLHFLPAPPDTTGEHFAHDVMRYFWGKQQRLNPERAAIAMRDAEYSLDCIIREFSEPFGLKISPTETPEIYRLLRDGTATAEKIGTLPKKHYMRKRPFMRFQEHMLSSWEEDELRHNGSYPSGHTILGWSSALLLSEINPARIDTIMARGYMYGESRVIVGAHWQSDVDAGRLVASVAIAKLHTSDRFLKQMQKAREEFAKKTKGKNWAEADGSVDPADASQFTTLAEAVPDAIMEIRYYGTYNFVGDRIDGYLEPTALLTKRAADSLRAVSDDVKAQGYRLKIYDAYRPQMGVDHFVRWAQNIGDTRMKSYFYPDLDKSVLFEQEYINERSGHTRGSTVDLTLFDMATEKELDMGGTFDWFGPESHPDFCGNPETGQYTGDNSKSPTGRRITAEQFRHRMILRQAMMRHGFKPLSSEWWHFTLKDEPFPDTYFTFPVKQLK